MNDNALALGEEKKNRTRASNYTKKKRSSKAQRKLKETIKQHNLHPEEVLFFLKSPKGWPTPYGGRFYKSPDGYLNSGLQADYLTKLMCENLIKKIESDKVKSFLGMVKATLLRHFVTYSLYRK